MTIIELLFASAILYLLVLATDFLASYTGTHRALAALLVVAVAVSTASLSASIVKRRADKGTFGDD